MLISDYICFQVTRVVLVGGFAQAAITRHILEEEFMKVSKVAAAFRPTVCLNEKPGAYV